MSAAPVHDELAAARADLHRRQGAGARYDAANAPARELAWARFGTGYFARLLAGLADADLDAPSRIAGVSRRHLVAHVGYHARALCGIAARARLDPDMPLPFAAAVDPDDVRDRATQPVRALRSLFAHTEIHLNVEWRDLDDASWNREVSDAVGRVVAVRRTPWLRARAIWLHALDLGAGGRLADAPPGFVAALASDPAAHGHRDGTTARLLDL